MYKEISKIDLSKYRMVSEYPKNRFEYNLKELDQDKNFVYSKDDEAKFVFKRCVFEPYIHFGEKVAYEIAKKVGIKCCRAELFNGVGGLWNNSTGVISYFDTSSDDNLLNPYWALTWYREKYGKNIFPASIDIIFDACKKYFFDDNNRPDKEFKEFVQDFIDMTIFDLKFGNYDRGDTNWLLRVGKKDGKYELYPMFDNETILGFTEDEPSPLTVENIEKFNDDFKSKVCTTEDGKRGKGSSMEDMIIFLLDNYPEQTSDAIMRVCKFKENDLEEILDNIPNLPESRREFAIKNFMYRDAIFRDVVKNYLADRKKDNAIGKKIFGEDR